MNKSQVIGMIKSLAGRGGSGGEDRYKTVTLVSGAVDFEYVTEDGVGFAMTIIEADTASIFPGNRLVVEWDGEKYEYPIPWIANGTNSFNYSDSLYFGNTEALGLPGSSNNEPFVVIVNEASMTVADATATENVTHEVKFEVLQDCYAPHVAFVRRCHDGENRLFKYQYETNSTLWGAKEFTEAYFSDRKMFIFDSSHRACGIAAVEINKLYTNGVAVKYAHWSGNEIERFTAYTDVEKR